MVDLMINHRWKKTYHWTVFWCLIAVTITMCLMIMQLPNQWKRGILTAFEDLSAKQQSEITKVNNDMTIYRDSVNKIIDSIDPECLVNKEE